MRYVRSRWRPPTHPRNSRDEQDPSTLLGPDGLDSLDPPHTGKRDIGDELVDLVGHVSVIIDVGQSRDPGSLRVLVLTLVELEVVVVFLRRDGHDEWKKVWWGEEER